MLKWAKFDKNRSEHFELCIRKVHRKFVKQTIGFGKSTALYRQTDGFPYFSAIKLMNSVWNTRHQVVTSGVV